MTKQRCNTFVIRLTLSVSVWELFFGFCVVQRWGNVRKMTCNINSYGKQAFFYPRWPSMVNQGNMNLKKVHPVGDFSNRTQRALCERDEETETALLLSNKKIRKRKSRHGRRNSQIQQTNPWAWRGTRLGWINSYRHTQYRGILTNSLPEVVCPPRGDRSQKKGLGGCFPIRGSLLNVLEGWTTSRTILLQSTTRTLAVLSSSTFAIVLHKSVSWQFWEGVISW